MISIMGLTVKALKKEPFSGSYHGMRYYLNTSDDTLNVWIYPEPWCFEQTPEEDKTYKDFSFTQEGLDDAITWINESWSTNQDYWEQMEKDKMRNLLYPGSKV